MRWKLLSVVFETIQLKRLLLWTLMYLAAFGVAALLLIYLEPIPEPCYCPVDAYCDCRPHLTLAATVAVFVDGTIGNLLTLIGILIAISLVLLKMAKRQVSRSLFPPVLAFVIAMTILKWIITLWFDWRLMIASR